MDTSVGFDFETLTVSNVVKTMTATKYNPVGDSATARTAFVTTEGGDMRMTLDGTTPVAGATGHLIVAGSQFTLEGYGNLANFKAIRNAGADVTVQVTYMR